MAKIAEKKGFIPSFENIDFTWNGALSYATTGSELADQFGKAGSHRGRDLEDVFRDQQRLWNEDNLQATKFAFYLRMITRKVKVNEQNITATVQSGQGARDESFKRFLWLAVNHSDVFYSNIWLLPMVGSWKDIWTIMFYDIIHGTNCINHEIMFDLINEGLKCGTHSELIKKYMPRIKSVSHTKTEWTTISNRLAKEFAKYNSLSFSEYNKLKTSGTAHDFQKLICSGRFKDINWSLIPGKALSLIATEKFLKEHKLENNYIEWVTNQPTVKFTGYVYELMKKLKYQGWERKLALAPYERITINKQFDELIKKASEDRKITGNVWCALDTSGSMSMEVVKGTSAFDICISLGVFFSTLNQGAFHKNVVMFDDKSYAKQLKGDFCDMVESIIKERTAWGSTNIQSVIDEMVNVRKNHPEIPLEDYPSTLLVVSDMQFNPGRGLNIETNYELMKKKLYDAFPQEFVDNMKFIWWNVNGTNTDVPAEIGVGQMFLSGFDGSIVSLLLGGEAAELEKEKGRPLTTEEMVSIALGQEILSYVKV